MGVGPLNAVLTKRTFRWTLRARKGSRAKGSRKDVDLVNVFLTGSTGVVGHRLVPLLLRSGHTVTAVAHRPETLGDLEQQGARAVVVDLFDAETVRRAVSGHDVVVNLATHIPASTLQMFLPGGWRENDRLRREASAVLVDAALVAGVHRFIQESFAPVYPDRGDSWIDETTPIEPVRYNRTIADAEAATERFSDQGGTGVVLRFGAFYGPDAYQTLDMMRWVDKGWAPMPGPRGAYLSSISHDDAATATAAALSVPAGTYNVVDDEPVTHEVFFETMAAALQVAPPRFPPPWLTVFFGSMGEMAARSTRIANRKLRAHSDWSPKYPSVREGMPQAVREARSGNERATGARAREHHV